MVVLALSWTVYQDTRYDIDARREELKQFLEDEHYTAHHENIKTAISIYDEDILPNEQRVWIREVRLLMNMIWSLKMDIHIGVKYI